MLTIKQLQEKPKYQTIINVLRVIQENKYNTGLELKHFRYLLVKNNKLNEKTKENMTKFFKFNNKMLSELDILFIFRKTIGENFLSEQDIFNHLKRLVPYVKPYPNSKPNKYHLTKFFYVEMIKHKTIEILKNFDNIKIENLNTFKEDGFLKMTFSKKDKGNLFISISNSYMNH